MSASRIKRVVLLARRGRASSSKAAQVKGRCNIQKKSVSPVGLSLRNINCV